MKKKTAILLCVSLGLSSLYGCQNKTAATAVPEQETAAATAQPEEQAEKENTVYDRSQVYGSVILQDGEEISGGTYTAEETDESVIEISASASATVTGSLLKKEKGDASNADASSFQGVNAAVRVYDDAELTLKDCAIEASADNATGVFSYNGGTIHISDSTVNVTGGGAGGIQVAGGGILYAEDLIVTSASKAAIRSDKGGGLLVVDGGTYTSTGKNGCPAIYSTAEIQVSDATLISENSRAVIIEGKNSVALTDCDLYGNDQSTKEGSVRANVLLYQSASGDASEGTSSFSATGGSITSYSGAMFYCTNTASVIDLKDTHLVLSDDGTLLIISTGRWGKDDQNGGDCTFNATDQILEGTVLVDSISSLRLNLVNSSFTGSVESEGEVSVTLDENSTWTLTADSYITSFEGDAANVISNGYTLYVNGVALTGTN